MRILSALEMEEVFGGQASSPQVTNTLTTVNVTANRVSTGNYWQGYSDFTSYGEYGGSSGSYHGGYYPALPQTLPTKESIECKAAAAAVAGHGPRAGWGEGVVNAHAYYNETNKNLVTKNTEYAQAPAGYQNIRGLSVATGGYVAATGAWTQGTTTLYAGAFSAIPTGFRSGAYYNDAGVFVPATSGVTFSNLTMIQHAVMVMAHEAQHQYQMANPGYLASLGRDTAAGKEADAEAYAIKALTNYRAGQVGSCP